jgi:Flp pilus assembly protein TadG
MKLSRFRRSECGAALVEFAIVLPLLLLLVFGIIDLGRLLYTYNNLTSAVREGARLASVQSNPTTGASISAVQSRVQQFAVSFGGNAGQPEVSVTPSSAYPSTQFVTVAIVNYPFVFITPLPALAGLRSTTISPSATFRWERAP